MGVVIVIRRAVRFDARLFFLRYGERDLSPILPATVADILGIAGIIYIVGRFFDVGPIIENRHPGFLPPGDLLILDFPGSW